MHPAILWTSSARPAVVRCEACSHYCMIPEGKRGVCGIRENQQGKLYSLNYGKLLGLHADPIEKKPLFHFLPGSRTYSFGTVGCNFHCEFCQNADMSQATKPLQGGSGEINGLDMTPESVIAAAKRHDCDSISYTYNEPAIFIEFALDTMKLAHKHGLKNVFVSNGYESPEAFAQLAPYLDAINIDLKSFSDDFYTKLCGGRLQPVLDTIKRVHEAGIWLEMTTLVIPGYNDSHAELQKIAKFIASLDARIPWHLSRFFPMHRLLDVSHTPMKTLESAYKAGKKAGLKHIYIGNVREDRYHDTCCPSCGEICVRRGAYYSGLKVEGKQGRCPSCSMKIAGVWS